MKNIVRWFLLMLFVLPLFACSNSEEQAQNQFSKIQQQTNETQIADSIQQYRQLIKTYPGTKAAELADQEIANLNKRRIKAEKTEALEAVKSLPRIIEGYKSMYRSWPKSIKSFDQGDYFFDSDYMAESIKDGYTAYLALTAADQGFKLWSVPKESDFGYQLTADGKRLLETEKTSLLQQIEANYLIEAQKGSLVVLLPKTNSKAL